MQIKYWSTVIECAYFEVNINAYLLLFRCICDDKQLFRCICNMEPSATGVATAVPTGVATRVPDDLTKKDLVMNILKGGQWGSYRHVPMKGKLCPMLRIFVRLKPME
jgi:hypothetical protein